jgi:hypothetical protein
MCKNIIGSAALPIDESIFFEGLNLDSAIESSRIKKKKISGIAILTRGSPYVWALIIK